MPNINSYPVISSLSSNDLLIVSDTSRKNSTKSVKIQALADYIGSSGGGGGTGTVTSVTGTGSVSGITLSGNVTESGSLTLGGSLSLTSQQVIGFLGYTPSSFDGDYDNLINKPSIPDGVFKSFAVDGQTTVTADSNSDTLTLVAGDNITIATDGALDTITINASSTLSNFANDIIVNSITVGTGAGDDSTNTTLGFEALNTNTQPNSGFNVAIGRRALYTKSSGGFNTAVGAGSMGSDTVSGSFNTGLGYNSLYNITSGDDNIAIGRSAQLNNTTGLKNVAIGTSSLTRIVDGDEGNVAIGHQSGYELTGGNGNVALGQWAGGTGTGTYIANDCVFIGKNAKPGGLNYTNQIVIGALAIGNGGNTVTLGNNDITDTYLKGNVNIPGDLEVTGNTIGVVGNNTDTYTDSPKVAQIVTLTQAEYNGITPSSSTLYIIVD